VLSQDVEITEAQMERLTEDAYVNLGKPPMSSISRREFCDWANLCQLRTNNSASLPNWLKVLTEPTGDDEARREPVPVRHICAMREVPITDRA
jgi:hypothetical protein